MATANVRRGVAAAAGLLVTFGVAAGCGGDSDDSSNEADDQVELIDSEKLLVCTNLPYVPFQFEDENGETVGFDVELVDLIADELGVEQEIVDLSFDQIQNGAALTSNQCDLAAAGMTITADREENLTFSDPYFDEVIAFMTPAGETIETIEEVEEQGLTLGVQADTTSMAYAEENGVEPVAFPDSANQRAALESGDVDVILQDLPVLNEWTATDEAFASDYEVGGVVETGAQYGIGMKKDVDPDLLETVNQVLADARESGEYDEIYEKWFGTAPTAS